MRSSDNNPRSPPLTEASVEPNRGLQALRRQLARWLTLMDFSMVYVEYGATNGRGSLLEPWCFRPRRADHWTVHGPRAAQLIELFSLLLDLRHPDWRDADGSFGSFWWAVDPDELIHTHCVRGASAHCHTRLGFDIARV